MQCMHNSAPPPLNPSRQSGAHGRDDISLSGAPSTLPFTDNNSPLTAYQERELHAVNVAVAMNCIILVAKLGVWTVTSSG